VNGVPDKGRDGRTGASHRPCLRNCWHASSVPGPSPSVRKVVTTEARRPHQALYVAIVASEAHVTISSILVTICFKVPSGISGYLGTAQAISTTAGREDRYSQLPGKARPRSVASRQDPGGGWGATEGSVLEGGSEGKGRPPADGRNSSAVRFAVGADCCGALGCRETNGLLMVERGHEQRVLCQYHARRWLDE
jgi:hypothetical protein